MKKSISMLGFILVVLFSSCTQQPDFPELKGLYLGQKPPDMTPEIFAPGIISTPYRDGSITFSPDGKELFYHFGGHGRTTILHMNQKDSRWSSPRVASFSGKYSEGEPHFSYDGKKLLFSSSRPLDGKGEPMTYMDIWFVEKTDTGWGEPKNFGFTINSEKNDLYPTLSRTGDLYFASNRDGEYDIYISENEDGEYTNPQKLCSAINSEFGDWDACLAPDESYMIFGSNGRSDGFGESDLYISFKKKDGTWTQSKNMGNIINTVDREVDPLITFDGKYIFFRSNRKIHKSFSESELTYDEFVKLLESPGNGDGDIYWVDARVIEALKPDELK